MYSVSAVYTHFSSDCFNYSSTFTLHLLRLQAFCEPQQQLEDSHLHLQMLQELKIYLSRATMIQMITKIFK